MTALTLQTAGVPALARSHDLAAAAAEPRNPGSEIDTFDVGGKEDLNKMSWPMRTAASILGGVGLMSGVIGGGFLGGSLAAAGSLTSGLLAQNVTWAAISSTGVWGACIGAVVMGGVGAVGGWQLAKGIQKMGHGALSLVFQGQRALELDKKSNMLGNMEKELDGFEARLNTSEKESADNARARTEDLDRREVGIADANARVADKTARKDELIQARAQALYDGKKAELDRYEQGLDQRQGALDEHLRRIERKEKEFPTLVDQRADQLFNARRDELHKAFTTRESGLNERERKLDAREQQIPQEVDRKVQAQLQPLRDQLAGVNARVHRNEEQARMLVLAAANDREQANRLRFDADQERRQADQARPAMEEARRAFTGVNETLQRESSQVESRKVRLAGWEADLRRREDALKAK